MPDGWGENEVFAEWQKATGDRKTELLNTLSVMLKKHASSIVWLEMRQHRPDIVDEALWKAIRSLEKFRGEAKLSTWFTHIVKNTIRSDVAKRKRRAEAQLDDSQHQLGHNPAEAIQAKLDLERLAVDLTDEERQLLEWKLDDTSETIIAEKTGLTREGVRSRWHRLRKKMLANIA